MNDSRNKPDGSPEQEHILQDVGALIREVVKLKAEIAQMRSESGTESKEAEAEPGVEIAFDEARSLVEAAENMRIGDNSEELLVGYMNIDVDELSASSFGAAMILANRSKRPEVVLPYLNRWMHLFYKAGFPQECHEQLWEIYAAATMYGRVPTNGCRTHAGVMTHLDFLLPGDQGYYIEK
ncbi:MAG TPA: hypothetical protein VK141_03075 [Nitrosomonas sp.]|nr:hypothetical protein [Nitrosomonas sp.]